MPEQVSGTEMSKWLNELCPIILDMLQDASLIAKREVRVVFFFIFLIYNLKQSCMSNCLLTLTMTLMCTVSSDDVLYLSK